MLVHTHPHNNHTRSGPMSRLTRSAAQLERAFQDLETVRGLQTRAQARRDAWPREILHTDAGHGGAR